MTDLWSALAEPFQYAFMQRAFAAAALVGVVCAVLGTFVVLRGMAFMGDALSHAILPGVAAGYLLHGGDRGPLFWWALGAALVSAFGIGAISRGARLREDTAIGIIFAGMFALGIAMVSTTRSYATDVTHILFGNILSAGPADLSRMAVFGALALGTVALLYKELVTYTFDPLFAATLRLPVRLLHYLLLALLAIGVVLGLQTVGVALIIALLVTPAAAASLITRRLPALMAVAAAVSVASGVAGLYISYYTGIATGPAIALICTVAFLIAFAFTRSRRSRTTSR
ncbi:MAG: metal ABC transporter permease [Kiritimatiellae bacterium]|nr:metal ABC transporter permease [Kiritimatiellia bacterium]MDW8457598.1 metal ABC transporter permease [Verrucomicrobiota bacterium]